MHGKHTKWRALKLIASPITAQYCIIFPCLSSVLFRGSRTSWSSTQRLIFVWRLNVKYSCFPPSAWVCPPSVAHEVLSDLFIYIYIYRKIRKEQRLPLLVNSNIAWSRCDDKMLQDAKCYFKCQDVRTYKYCIDSQGWPSAIKHCPLLGISKDMMQYI